MNKFIWFFILIFISGVSILSGCEDKKTSGTGFLSGIISIGPLCPVERIPPDPACSPTAETYKAYQVAVYSSDGTDIIAELNPSLNGSYITELPAGRYKINLESGIAKIGSSNLPMEITIEKSDTTKLTINIDTGIR